MPVSSREPRGSLPPTSTHWARHVLVPSALGRSSTHFQPLSSRCLLTRKVQPSTNAGHMKRHILFFLKHRCCHRPLHWPRSCRPGRCCSEPQTCPEAPGHSAGPPAGWGAGPALRATPARLTCIPYLSLDPLPQHQQLQALLLSRSSPGQSPCLPA